jgi:hypothetical protein
MVIHKTLSGLFIIFLSIISHSCTALNSKSPSQDSILQTQTASTVFANLTQNAPVPTPTTTHTPRPPRPSRTPTLTLTSTATTTKEALLVDDFSEISGWGIDTTDNYSYGYADGGYRIRIEIPFITVWSTRQLELSNVSLEVSAQQLNGPENGFFGLTCRQQIDGYNYYVLVVNSYGFFAIGKVANGSLEFIEQGMDTSNIVQTGKSNNQIKAECVGENLRLFVNGEILAESQDNSFATGFIGLVAGIQGMGYDLEVLFDNFLATTP